MERISINPGDEGVHNLSMNIYIMERELLVEKVTEATAEGCFIWIGICLHRIWAG